MVSHVRKINKNWYLSGATVLGLFSYVSILGDGETNSPRWDMNETTFSRRSTPEVQQCVSPYTKYYDPCVDVTPSARGCLPCYNSGPYIVGSFIYWRSSFDEMDFAATTTNPNGNITTIVLKQEEFDYKPGFKLGLGYNFAYDGWDIFVNWTWLSQTLPEPLMALLK